MICRCFGKTLDLAAAGRQTRETLLMLLGAPNYDAYLAHMKTTHPQATPLTREAFFAARLSRLRCC